MAGVTITAVLPEHGAIIAAVLDGFVQAAQLEIESGVVPPFPTMVGSLRFVPEPPPSEQWLLPHQVIAAGGGDCEDYAIWTAAGYRATGRDPLAAPRLMQTGPQTLHCVVQRGDGTVEDPSADIRRRGSKQPKTVGAQVTYRDHRTGAKTSSSSAPPAAATATPMQGNPALVALAKYASDKGQRNVTFVDPVAFLQAQGYKKSVAEQANDFMPADVRAHAEARQGGILDAMAAGEYRGPVADYGKSVRREDDSNFVWEGDEDTGYIRRATADERYDIDNTPTDDQLDPYIDNAIDYMTYGYDPYTYYGPQWDYSGEGEGYAGWYSSADDAPLTYADLYGINADDMLDSADDGVDVVDEYDNVDAAIDANPEAA